MSEQGEGIRNRGKVDKGYSIEIIAVGNVCDTAVEWPF